MNDPFKIVLFLLGFLSSLTVFAQKDSIVFTNGNVIVGEAKSLSKNILVFKTEYSDSDFQIEWDKVSVFYSETTFFVTLSNGNRFQGQFRSPTPETWHIATLDGGRVAVNREQIVEFKSFSRDFWSRVNASIDANFSLTKANNLKQLGTRASLGYTASKWWLKGTYNMLRSDQDDIDPVKRIDGELSNRLFLPKDWYVSNILSFLSNTEQLLRLRSNLRAGMGKYVIHTNKSYLAFEGGVSGLNEIYDSEDQTLKSFELYAGGEWNLYDAGDFSLLTRLVAYPSLTEGGRWRFDYVLDTKYDLPLDFYIKIGVTLNYDNRAVEGATALDYVLQTGIGWEFN